MSQGNRISQGGKGTNYPYQSKVLKGLQQSIDELEDINANTSLITGLATEITLQSVLTAFNTTDFATETTLQSVDTNSGNIVTNTTGVLRRPGIIRPTGVGNLNTVAAQLYSVSVANTGLTDGEILGEVIRPGEILNFAADSLNNYFTSFDYDATGTDFVITFIY